MHLKGKVIGILLDIKTENLGRGGPRGAEKGKVRNMLELSPGEDV